MTRRAQRVATLVGGRAKLAVVASFASACLALPAQPVITCEVASDCPHQGDVCDQGMCWGAPANGGLSALIAPPASEPGLALTEVLTTSIAPDGTVADLEVRGSTKISATLAIACPPPFSCADITGATISITRESKIAGAPAFRSVQSVDFGNVKETGNVSFDLRLPRSSTVIGDFPFVVTITPTANPTGLSEGFALLPPVRLLLDGSAPRQAWTLGGDLPSLAGRITDAAGAPLQGYRVYAHGYWNTGDAPALVSSIVSTDQDGRYQLLLANGLVNGVQVFAEPTQPGAGVLRAVVPAFGPSLGRATYGIDLAVPDRLTVPTLIEYRLVGTTGSGEVQPIAGAVVNMSAVVVNSRPPTYATEHLLGDTSTTNDDGVAFLNLVGSAAGARVTYRVTIAPPANSQFAAVFGDTFTLDSPRMRTLAPRVAVRGAVGTENGEALKKVSVTVKPSQAYLGSLTPLARSFVSKLPLPTATSSEQGEFLLWVDAPIGSAATYDVTLESADVLPLRWTAINAISTAAQSDMVVAGPFLRPAIANVRGAIETAGGTRVANSEVLLYRRGAEVPCPAPQTGMCVLAATLVGRATTDDNGTYAIAVPRQ